MTSFKTKTVNWLDNPDLAGITACCVRCASGELTTQTAGADLSNASIEAALISGHKTALAMQTLGLLPGRIRWTCTEGTFHLALRSDGDAMALCCKPTPAAPRAVEQFLERFLEES